MTDGSSYGSRPRRVSERPWKLSPKGAQVSLDASDGDLVAVWADRQTGVGRIMTARLGRDGALGLTVKARCPADTADPVADQLVPTAAQVGDRLVVAWEDRRPGHTIIMATASAPGQPCRFDPPVRISEDPPGPELPFGAGHGVARVAVAPYGADRLLAAWEDKRNFRHGYDVYAAHFGPSGFGPNERVQDDFGELSAQWHVSAAGHPDGTLVVAWTDEREGQGDILLSWYADGTWSEDLPLPGASGPEEQGHPVHRPGRRRQPPRRLGDTRRQGWPDPHPIPFRAARRLTPEQGISAAHALQDLPGLGAIGRLQSPTSPTLPIDPLSKITKKTVRTPTTCRAEARPRS